MRLLVLIPSPKVVESREARLCVVDGMQSPEVGRPRTVEVEEQRADGTGVIGEAARVFPTWEAVTVSSAFDIKK